MLYKIEDNYYIRVGRKYIEVKILVKDGDVSLEPNHKKYIEDNGGLKVTEQVFNDEFVKKIIESRKPRPTEEHKEKETNRSRFGR
jgi:hypothetical protein